MSLRKLLSLGKAPLRPMRNFYYRSYPKLRYAITGKKRILLYVNNQAMTSHIQRYAEPLVQNPAYSFFLYAPESPLDRDASGAFERFVRENPIRPVTHPGRYAWDLIVCADLRTPASFTRAMTPLLYVNHGLHLLSADGGETLYGYGEYAWGEDGEPKFTLMCEPNAIIAQEMQAHDPVMATVIRHVGYKFSAEAADCLRRREAFRQRLGISPETCLVGLFGSWRENSLFHALGQELFDACLSQRERGYQFLFSIHPKEYGVYDERLTPMGPLVDAQRERGMLVRDPGEDFAPFMAAADIVISDFSSMAETAMIFGRKLIFSPYPDGMVWKHSLTAKARKALPTLPSAEALGPLLDAVRDAPIDAFIEKARAQLYLPGHDEIMGRITRELLRL